MLLQFRWNVRSLKRMADQVGLAALSTAIFLFSSLEANADPPMTFTGASRGGNCDDCSWIAEEGEITEDTPSQFTQFMSGWGSGPYMYLNSPGGNLLAGIKLGKLFRKNNIKANVGHTIKGASPNGEDDLVEGICASACSYAFLGGTTRDASPNQIGVHRFSVAIDNLRASPSTLRDNSNGTSSFTWSSAQIVTAFLIDYVISMGVDPRFVSAASSTEQIHYLTNLELDQFRVRWSAEAFGPWHIRPSGNGVIAFSVRNDDKQTALVFCRSDKIPQLQIIGISDYDRVTGDLSELNGLDVLGIEVPGKDVATRMTNGKAELDVKLKGFNPSSMIGKEDLSVRGQIVHAEWSYFSFMLSATDAVPAISVALRNCI
jgi:hypothetical protein